MASRGSRCAQNMPKVVRIWVLALALSGVRWLQTHRDEETEAQYRAEHAATIFRGLREEDQILQQSASSSDGVPGYGSTNN
ncbi:hypothetical protein BGX27_004701 [Mortierella sp. AM989]|nr:hypothetical protein BGX27_004701 [Mortierella sp. AM989]